jgi:galactoside 2-L-fucosyltransferase 1/2
MAYFDECLPRAHFIVISDDISWCRQNMKPFGQHTIDFIDGERSPAVDLAIASLCDHAIITFGTFGWWAAWFANGLTLVNSQDTFKVWRPPFNSRAVVISLQPA